ncbi:MAG TPA: hypothetical protein VKB57_23730 [Acidimicrobiales bacterium]|nr:hypothetical protein [Acidimicrobiales bacterium]
MTARATTRSNAREIRDGRAWCRHHGRWEPVEDFDWAKAKVGTDPTQPSRIPKPDCRLAEQTIRDHGREADPARFAIEGRAKSFAGELSKALGNTIGYHFVLIELNWRALTPIMRALLAPDGLCLNCGRHRQAARHLHIEHRIPPLCLADWPAQHARNLWIACGGCNVEKGRNDADRAWLEREHRKWVIDREWATHAGERGWPAYDPAFGSDRPRLPEFVQLSIEDAL